MARGSSITLRDLERMLCDESAEPKALPLSLLEEITDGFSDEQQIGRGAFAVVYKGKLKNWTVAVKRMSNTYMYEKEFQREVECLMIVKHRNVVRFLGYCADTQGSMERCDGKFVMADVQQRLLCFEYLSKGSLHEYITDTSCRLRWRDRYQIITGICQGLHYLHHKNILHLDLKPANILLDDNWVPKIADFGISRCFDQMQSQVISKIAGTPGYLAPESFNHIEVTYRNSYRLDIYSLGVVIIEILTGKKGYHDVDQVVESWSDMLEESQREVQLEQVRVCAEIGIECTNFNPAKRPDTQHIISRFSETESMGVYTEAGLNTSQRVLASQLGPHYDDLFRLKSLATKSDVFHVLSGMWMSPAELFFMWLGGFRSSEILKVLASQLGPLTDGQRMAICNMQQSSQQAEDTLSQGMEALQQALAETLAVPPAAGANSATNYMGQMAVAMGKLGTLENFLRQGDLLRQQTLQHLWRILTTRQAARALLAVSDYFSRLRALSSLWVARPRD